jgi:GNAT superfamily N-acetyltransferase
MSRALLIRGVGPRNRASIRGFIELGNAPYRNEALKVPPPRGSLIGILRRRDPFFRHGDATSFLALRDGSAVGRITAFEDRAYNEHHLRREARFCWFESLSGEESARGLFGAAESWARDRGLDELRGPYAVSGLEGAGILVDGFERAQTMTMSAWNPPRYAALFESAGLVPFKDLLSAEILTERFALPERVARAVSLIEKRGRLSLLPLRTLSSLLRLAPALGELYNRSFSEHDDFMPLEKRDFSVLARGLAALTEPSLVKILAYEGAPAGFLFAFPDLSAAFRRAGGRLRPWNLLDLALEKGRTRRLIVNGAGVDPERQRLGGNAVLYAELERVVRERLYEAVEIVQVAATNAQMIADLEMLGGTVVKRHRIWRKGLD